MSHLGATLTSLILLTTQSAAVSLPTTLDLEAVRALPVQTDGRWAPLDTLARDHVESLTGDLFFQGHDPVLLLLAWTFDSATWRQQPLIELGNKELRAALRLPAEQTVFSYDELTNHRHLLDLIDKLNTISGRKPDPLESKVDDIYGKLVKLQSVFSGRAIRLIPDPMNVGGAWRTVDEVMPGQTPELARGVAAWDELRAGFATDNATQFSAAARELSDALQKLPTANRPAAALIATELRYNRIRPFRTAWMVMVVGAVLSAAALLVRRTWFDVLTFIGLLAGFGVLTYGLSLRWQIAGRIPAANMYESLLFLSWGMGIFAAIATLVLRQRTVPLTASAMGATALILAEQVIPGASHYVRPIPPVLLDTFWMSVHVPIIMASYAVLALAMVIAHAQLVMMAVVPRRRELAEGVDRLHYWYVLVGSLLLLAGIATGSMWAASSWGRYWGWDSKEVWSLAAFLGYMAILHLRVDREPSPPWANLGVLFSLRGRCGRGGYLLGTLAINAVGYVTLFTLGVTDWLAGILSLTAIPQLIVWIACAVMGTCLVVRRLHDLGRPGTHCLLLLVPIYNIYLGLVLLFGRGSGGPNRYGPEPAAEGYDVRPMAMLLCVTILYAAATKLAPLTAGKVLGVSGMLAGLAIFLFARGLFATAVKSVLCFWLIIMTYVGVNYVLGTGLHSYGFGTGAVANRMFLIGGVDLGIVLACSALYLIRREGAAPPPQGRVAMAS